MCGGSGGGASGDTTYNWNPSMQPRWDRYLNLTERALFPKGIDEAYPDLSKFQRYQGQRFADPSYGQRAGVANTYSLAQMTPSPLDSLDPETGQLRRGAYNLASDMTRDTLAGKYQDPYASQKTNVGVNYQAAAGNPWGGVAATPRANAFQGMDNPYFKQVLQQGQQDLVDSWTQGTKQDTDRMAVLGGAFGGSDHQKAMANNAAALGKTLGAYNAGMNNAQYERSAGLDEALIGRDLQAQMFNKETGGNWTENQLNRQNNAVESYLGRDVQAQQFDRGLGSQAWQNERARQMGAADRGYGEQGLAGDRLGMLFNAGALDRQLGLYGPGQQDLDFEYQQQQEENNWPFKLMQLLQGTYSTAQGNTGQQVQAYGGGNNWGNVLGGLLGAYSLS